ncbi:hypothetical protein [Phaeobacter sp. S60]|uniref:hypothetical protein n=1 Tax=Phaeobacter sp. S60 TaxID=1569353 RepID=UPI00058CE6F8|nr:hypothetical protein [Phaeobacter sp. S60]KII11390.1 hypothetical protein OO25_21345 [Phaeobacter sp. S60]
MTAHARIDDQEAQQAAQWNACCRALQAALDAAEGLPDGRRAIGEALCAALDTVGAGAPRYEMFGDLRAEADWWSDTATPLEIEIYAAAALKRIHNATFATRARKRLFMAMWGEFTDQERGAFLANVNRQRG